MNLPGKNRTWAIWSQSYSLQLVVQIVGLFVAQEFIEKIVESKSALSKFARLNKYEGGDEDINKRWLYNIADLYTPTPSQINGIYWSWKLYGINVWPGRLHTQVKNANVVKVHVD